MMEFPAMFEMAKAGFLWVDSKPLEAKPNWLFHHGSSEGDYHGISQLYHVIYHVLMEVFTNKHLLVLSREWMGLGEWDDYY